MWQAIKIGERKRLEPGLVLLFFWEKIEKWFGSTAPSPPLFSIFLESVSLKLKLTDLWHFIQSKTITFYSSTRAFSPEETS